MIKRDFRVPPEALDRQRELMGRVALRSRSLPRPPKALIDTYGCQQNEADSERLRGMLREMGYTFTEDENEADLVLFNTCAIREHAEHRVFGNIGALVHTKRRNPDQIIILCGCMAQEPTVVERVRQSFRHVDLVFGPHALWRFPELLSQVLEGRGRIFDEDHSDGFIAEGLPVQRKGGVKAWLSVMYGCNNFCSYCIVPYVRGRERSREQRDILADAETLLSEGVRDITLLGQNVNSYGRGLSEEIDFSTLLESLSRLPGEFLLRFMTSHPKDATKRLFDTMAASLRIAHHIHLPFQSGNDRVLKAMNRGYTAEHYRELVDYARSVMPDLTLTSDVIVGFPGETEAEFRDTLTLIKEVGYDALFTFLFSPRPGTPAAAMPDPVPREEKQVWFDELVAAQNAISAEKHRAYVGKTVRVLVDGLGDDSRYPVTARTGGNRLVRLTGGQDRIGRFINVKITDSNQWSLCGEPEE